MVMKHESGNVEKKRRQKALISKCSNSRHDSLHKDISNYGSVREAQKGGTQSSPVLGRQRGVGWGGGASV